MTEIRFAVEIDAPPERAWVVVGDPRKLGHWDRHIAVVEGVPDEGLAEGVEYVSIMKFMGVHARVRARVLEWDPPRRSVIELSGVLDAIVTTTLMDSGEGRTLLEHRVDYRFRGGPLGEFAARSLRLLGGAHLALRHGTMAQKREIEGG